MKKKSRQIVLVSATPQQPLGSAQEIRRGLAPFNTAPDGAARSATAVTEVLHGPGMVLEFATSSDEIVQILATMLDEDIAWPVLAKACRSLKWKMVDPESGRSFG